MDVPTENLRVLELGASESAGMAGMILSDLGVEVIRVDTPLPDGEERVQSNEDAVAFGLATDMDRVCDRGKKRIFLDLRDNTQRTLFIRLLSTCDGVLDGYRSGVMASLGLGEEALQAAAPGLIYTQVTGYGAFGPYMDRLWSEAVLQAESGFVSTTGPENEAPVRCGGDIATAFGGLMACIAMLIGLLERQKHPSSPGRYADVSMLDCLLFGMENQFSLYLKSGSIPKPRGNSYALSAPVGNFLCGDGKEIMISVATEAQWQTFAEAFHKESWLTRPEFVNVSQRIKHYKLLEREVSAVFAQYTREKLMEVLQSRSCVYGCINDFPTVVGHSQVASRGTFMKVIGSDGQAFTAPANPIATNGCAYSAVIHRSGADTATILDMLKDSECQHSFD